MHTQIVVRQERDGEITAAPRDHFGPTATDMAGAPQDQQAFPEDLYL